MFIEYILDTVVNTECWKTINPSWFQKMETLGLRVENSVLQILLTLAKTTKSRKYKDMYRYALTAKRDSTQKDFKEFVEESFDVHTLLTNLKNIN